MIIFVFSNESPVIHSGSQHQGLSGRDVWGTSALYKNCRLHTIPPPRAGPSLRLRMNVANFFFALGFRDLSPFAQSSSTLSPEKMPSRKANPGFPFLFVPQNSKHPGWSALRVRINWMQMGTNRSEHWQQTLQGAAPWRWFNT